MQVAKALLFDANDHILVLRRSHTHPTYAFQLDFPGGEVEPGESAIMAAAREIHEETGLKIHHQTLTLAHHAVAEDGYRHLVFRAKLAAVRPTIEISWEHDQHQWMTAGQLLEVSHPSDVDDYFVTVSDYLRSVSSSVIG